MFSQGQLDRFYRYGLALCHDSDIAYDLLYDCLAKYLEQPPLNVPSASNYLMRMIRNRYIDLHRKQKIRLIKNEELQSERQNEPTLEDLYLLENSVAKLMEVLTSQERELLYLWAVEEYTVEEISQFQSQPRGTLLSRLHRLKKKLQNCAHELNIEANEV